MNEFTQNDFIMMLLTVIGFIGALAVKQLMKIAASIGEIKVDIKGLTVEHSNLKENHEDLKNRVSILENENNGSRNNY